MINNSNTPLKAYQVSNSSLNDVNSSLYGTNSSFGDNVSKQPAKCSKNTKSHLLLKGEKKWCNTGDYPFFSQVCKKIHSLAIPFVEPIHHQLKNTNRIKAQKFADLEQYLAQDLQHYSEDYLAVLKKEPEVEL